MNNYTSEDLIQAMEEIPLARVGKEEDITDVVCFLASSDARYITGSTLVVDGGLLLRRG